MTQGSMAGSKVLMKSLTGQNLVLLALGDHLVKLLTILSSFLPSCSCFKRWIQLGRGQRWKGSVLERKASSGLVAQEK